MQVGKTDTINTPDIREKMPINSSTDNFLLQRIATRAEFDKDLMVAMPTAPTAYPTANPMPPRA